MANGRISQGRLFIGLLFIALGVLFLLDRFHIIYFGEFFSVWWPSLLIIFGVVRLIRRRFFRPFFPLLVILIGVLLLGDNLGYFPWLSWELFWPALLIFIGLWMLLSRLRWGSSGSSASGSATETTSERVDAFAFWSGIHRTVTSKAFRGGEATAFMGGVELDLRGAELAPGEQRLDLTAVMGGVELSVPPGWAVAVEGTPIMAGIEDKRTPPPADAPPAAGTLRVHCFAFWGGIEIKS